MPFPDVLVLGLVGLLSFGLSYLGASVGLVFGQLRLPVLVYWLGSPTVGAATSMAISAVAALVGAGRHARAGRVDVRLILTIGIPSALCAGVSARLAPRLDPALVKLFIGLALVCTGLVMLWSSLRPPPEVSEPTAPVEPAAHDSVPAASAPAHPLAEIGMGAGLGAVSGVVGLLLGTLRLPAMMKLGVPPTIAIGTNMAIGSVTGLFAGAAALSDGTVDLRAFAVITPATMIGAYLGASTTGRLDKTTLRRLIAWSLLLAGAWMGADPWW